MSVAPTPVTGTPFDAPGAQPLSIGGTTFWTSECPSDLKFGGEQKVATTELVGGGKVTHALGPQFKDVSWKGNLWQPNVDSRIADLDAMRIAGVEVPLSWWTKQFFCIVKEFDATYHNVNAALYEITVEVTRAANGSQPQASGPSADDAVNGLQQAAQAANAQLAAQDPSGSAPFQQALKAVQSAIAAAGPISQLVGSQAQIVTNAIANALNAVNTYVATQPDSTPTYASASQLAACLTLISRNVANGQTRRTLQVQGGDLRRISVLIYNDITQWPNLMVANNLYTPILSQNVVTTIYLPPFPVAPSS